MPLQINKEMLSMKTTSDEKHTHLNMIEDNFPTINAEIEVSKDMYNKKTTVHLDDCNNNSRKITPKCIISENVIFKPKYTILKPTPTKTDQKEERQEIFKSPERKKRKLSNKDDNVSPLNLSSYNDGNNSSKNTNVTQDTISEYEPTDETQISEINKTEITEDSESNISEISNVSGNSKYTNQFKYNVPGNSACDASELTAELSHGPKGDNKKNFCVFCHTLQSKIARHLENKHRNEDQVKEFLNLPKGCAERLHKIANIRKEGNFIFNATKEYNHGRMITVRRPTQQTKQNGVNFINCPYCGGYYTLNNLRHHARYCNENEESSRKILQNARRALGRCHPETSRRMRVEILPVLQEDEITKAIRYDRAIILYGNSMCKSQVHQHQNTYIRSHLRLLGRLVLALRNRNSEIKTLAAAYAPQFYRTVIEAINDVAEFEYETNMYKHPTNASTLGTCLKKIGKILDVTYMIDKDEIKRKDVDDFMKIYDVDFSGTVNKVAIETNTKIKRQKKTILPRTSDIKSLTDYLKRKLEANIEILSKEFSYEVWKSLAEVTLIAIQVFNRRRAGETERILINDYKNYECACGTSTTCKTSVKSDKTHNYVRFTIRGKLNRTVPVLLDTQMLKSIQLLLQFRKDAQVPSKNPYLFGLPSKDKSHYKHLQACKLMRDFASACGAKNVSLLRGTALRKHVATKCVDLNLSDNQVTRVANFMGHHEQIHKQIYRQPVARVDILEMSKILLKAQGADTTTSNETDVTMNNENDLSFNNQDESQTFGDVNEGTCVDTSIEAKENKVTKGKKKKQKVKKQVTNYNLRKKQTFGDINEETCVDTSIEAKENKVTERKKKKQNVKKQVTSNLRKKQNIYSKNKGVIYRHKTCKKKVRWTNEEKTNAKTYFAKYLRKEKLPPLAVIEEVKRKYKILQSRPTEVVKAWLNNLLQNNKKEKKNKEEQK
ncbi:uncharacterized protein LOC143902074 isoform X2 [Temnothorax americanus]|uniref:uncharacterized protein LOC143902074 isoform X2 n=1 Tax=Temnothorax americanus TaxID=1964332 RepID=UPI004067DC8A